MSGSRWNMAGTVPSSRKSSKFEYQTASFGLFVPGCSVKVTFSASTS